MFFWKSDENMLLSCRIRRKMQILKENIREIYKFHVKLEKCTVAKVLKICHLGSRKIIISTPDLFFFLLTSLEIITRAMAMLRTSSSLKEKIPASFYVHY